jgi:hypothetical protein
MRVKAQSLHFGMYQQKTKMYLLHEQKVKPLGAQGFFSCE